MALSGNKIVASNFDVIRVFNVSTCLLDVVYILLVTMSLSTVDMIGQFPEEDVHCEALAMHGDVVYAAVYQGIIQWNLVTESGIKNQGYPGLI